MVALAIVAILGLAFWAYLTWKKRKLGSVLKQQTMDDQVIEGEATIVEDDVSRTDRVLPPIQKKIYRNWKAITENHLSFLGFQHVKQANLAFQKVLQQA